MLMGLALAWQGQRVSHGPATFQFITRRLSCLAAAAMAAAFPTALELQMYDLGAYHIRVSITSSMAGPQPGTAAVLSVTYRATCNHWLMHLPNRSFNRSFRALYCSWPQMAGVSRRKVAEGQGLPSWEAP